jgi:predicted nucleic acid-binding protein
MSAHLWDGRGPVLADTSAWIAAQRDGAVRERLVAAIDRGEVTWCWPVRYELTIDARSAADIASLDRTLEGLREVPVDRGVRRGVLATMRELAATGSHGSHRFPLTDLTVAVAAQSAGLDLLHFDRHFDRLGKLLKVRTPWIVMPSA